MKKLLPTLYLICSLQSIFSQPYANEWINYDQQYLKFPIAADGIYRINYDALNEALNLVGVSLSSINPHHFQLFNKGEEQFIYIDGEADGIFNTSDYLEFYGRANDGTFDSLLYDNADYQLHTYESIINDTAMYFLTWNNLFTNNRLSILENNLTDAPAPVAYHNYHVKTVWGSIYGSGNFNGGPTYYEIFSSKYENGEGYTTFKYNLSNFNPTINTPGIYTGAAFTPNLKTTVIGVNSSEHHTVITLNGTVLKDTTYTGYKVLRYNFDVDNLVDINTVIFSTGPLTTDYQRYAFMDINYPRIFDFDNASTINTEIPAIAGASTYMEFEDFNENFTAPILYDLSEHKRITAIVESDISKFHLNYNASGSAIFVANQDATVIMAVNELYPVSFVDYTNPANQGDYIIISNKLLYDDGAGVNWVNEYKNYRSVTGPDPFGAIVADIDQLYDAFAYGIKKHPLAIRNFLMYAIDSFAVKPEFVFLIGKSFSYDVTRAEATPEYALNLVPTFGHPGADVMLASRRGTVLPLIPIGRISAQSGNDVKIYFEKITAFESVQQDPLQTIANKAWMKNVLHFAGGLNAFEQSLFNSFLFQYQDIIEDSLYGGNVYQFNKISGDPIFYSESEYVDSLINSGVSLITFFGHSSSGSFDYNIGDPATFNNEGKYFAVFGNGCNTAAIHGETFTLGEQYIFADHKAAIAFIAASNFSLASNLHTFATIFYRELSAYAYNLPIGVALKNTADTLWPTLNIFDQITSENMTLQGDPALRLNTHNQPDYVIEEPYVFFEPNVITAATDTFYLNVVVTNIGMALDSSYYVEVKRTKPSGDVVTFLERFDATFFRDTLRIPFATDPVAGIGENDFNIHIDRFNEIAEPDELNNILGASTFIIADDAIPIYPVEFSIMNHVPEYFAASTAYTFATVKDYIIQADTTMFFNSPFLRATMVTESGGVIKWLNPPVTYINDVVYYWRITPDTASGIAPIWRSSSFLYLPGEITGWNQSHYFQYLEDDYQYIGLQPSRTFEFVPDVQTYEVATGIYPTTNWTEVTSFANGELLAASSCASAGFVVLVADANSGQLWQVSEVGATNTGPYGDIYCSSDPFERVIQFNTNTPAAREILYQFMMSTVPDSTYFMCYSNNYAEFNAWLGDTLIYGHSLFDAFEAYGALDINSLAVFDYDRSYIFYAQKGAPETKFEIIGDPLGTKISATFVVEGNWNQGNIATPLIGPAYSWDKAQWDLFSLDDENFDINGIDIIGVNYDGAETLLSTALQSGDTSIAFIDAATYPYLKLQLNTLDDTSRTPAQFNYWRVIYAPVPEAALNQHVHFVYNSDSVTQGTPVQLEIAVTNVSDYNMDSLLIGFSVIDANNINHAIPYSRQDSLLSDNTMIATLAFSSADVPAGNNLLKIEVNPENDQPEQYHFNNIGLLPFYNGKDISGPLLDVTFDGVHIFDGDIVSAKPEIVINLKDENPYLALADTALLKIAIKYPDEVVRDFYYDGVTTKFYPADTSNLTEHNQARVEVAPVFDIDGIYELQVHGEDESGNVAGDIDYRITFEVINKAMVSNVMNYPNPFSSQTKFVFTLTGSEVPDYFKIQIMTVSGKIVREIMRNQLGDLHIGNNITEFAWDGTDQFGDQLANGLYLYRVVTRLNGESLEKYNTNTDQYFNSGYGKMYLAK